MANKLIKVSASICEKLNFNDKAGKNISRQLQQCNDFKETVKS